MKSGDGALLEEVELQGQDGLETYVCEHTTTDLERLEVSEFDIVFVATPDYAHVTSIKFWLDRLSDRIGFVVVEKPFAVSADQVDEIRLLEASFENDQGYVPLLLGFDHYLLYGLPLVTSTQILASVGTPTEVVFHMTEPGPIEHDRLPSLQHGMSFDMFSHCLGLLALFFDLSELGRFELHGAGRHRFARFDQLKDKAYFAETYGEVSFDIPLKTSSPHEKSWVSCYARFGKALPSESKFIEIAGANGNRIRMDLTKKDDSSVAYRYPFRNLIAIADICPSEVAGVRGMKLQPPEGIEDGQASVLRQTVIHHDPGAEWVVDHHQPNFMLQVSDKEENSYSAVCGRHGILVSALVNDDDVPFEALLSLDDAFHIMKALERLRTEIVGLPTHHPGWAPWQPPAR